MRLQASTLAHSRRLTNGGWMNKLFQLNSFQKKHLESYLHKGLLGHRQSTNMHTATLPERHTLFASAATVFGVGDIHSWMGERVSPADRIDFEIREESSNDEAAESGISAPVRPFCVDKYIAQLTTKHNLGRYIVYAPRCESTHTLCLDDYPKLSIGSVVVADKQGASKGRGTNVWDSPPGQLAFSFKIMIKHPSQLVCMQYLVSLAVVKACEVYMPERSVRLKWPNDIYTNDKVKIGGILCNSVYNSEKKEFEIVCGVGLNVFNDQPTTCLASMMSHISDLDQGSFPPLEREGLLAHFMNIFERDLELYRVRDFQPFLPDYLKKWLHSDERLTLQADGLTVTVKVCGERREWEFSTAPIGL
ncbi:hypothetical protein, variant [Sphaeroforma arctica JP610]|uniref:BPL/LPL catalytic domain-containing protein n=1 Tax=Sphaeroforma arctica JP610 TaxID=667725 RepID=A0A0L0FW77_9EUKA|nr:hypothetical protein, variant [Sphaeroforma arctica JP610]KNC81075.1 hypothetical protein, variant [Sphaeroforma arctica JP610]|eukprot:XP_014154977.1 hypothetical protein, variant [Sphaeroforma arctica JP610]